MFLELLSSHLAFIIGNKASKSWIGQKQKQESIVSVAGCAGCVLEEKMGVSCGEAPS